MIKRSIPRLALVLLILLIFVTSIYAIASGNTVPVTRLTDQGSAVTASALAPPECNSIRSTLTTIVQCTGGHCNGTQGNDLILGSPYADDIKGKNGNDCILGGDGDDDTLSGDNGTDVCIGGNGNDTFKKCEIEIQ